MKKIQNLTLFIKKNFYLAVAAELIFAIVLTSISFGSASAGQLLDRSITMSDSGRSGGTITSGIGSGANVVYRVQFEFPATTSIAGIAIDFCSNSALAGDACTAPTGFNVNRSTTSLVTQTGIGAGTMAIKTSSETLNNRIIITRATAAAVSTSTPADIVFGTGAATNGFTNPSANGTFYARIFTYTTQTGANNHNTAAATGFLDNGGIALSIANVITITARVQENLTFCMSLAAPGANCSGTSTPAITIGHGTTSTIDSTQIDTGTAYSQLSTNAISGAIVRIHNSNGGCGGLSTDGGTTCSIPPVNGGTNAQPIGPGSNMQAGFAAFGIRIAAGTGGIGSVGPLPPYNGASGDLYGMDTTSASNVTTTYGSSAISSTTPVSNVNNTWTFAATASNVTPAGIYTANIAAIATGTF